MSSAQRWFEGTWPSGKGLLRTTCLADALLLFLLLLLLLLLLSV
jgi:hypothetical protein